MRLHRRKPPPFYFSSAFLKSLLFFLPSFLFLSTHYYTSSVLPQTQIKPQPQGLVPVSYPPHLANKPDPYLGPAWTSPLLVSRKVWHASKFARCESHTVKSEDGKTLQEDWLWMDELDHVNAIVFERSSSSLDISAGKFIFFIQKKYALRYESLALVGGFVDIGQNEIPLSACRREVLEEIGYVSRNDYDSSIEKNTVAYNVHTDTNWQVLGKFRTAANRGGGYLTTCLLDDALKAPSSLLADYAGNGNGEGTAAVDGNKQGEKDGEAQVMVKFSFEEAKVALLEGRFGEVKWTASLAIAILKMEGEDLKRRMKEKEKSI